MMNVDEIEQFFNHYKIAISSINKEEKKLLKCSYNFEKWSAFLEGKSKKIRHFYEINDKAMKELLNFTSDELTDEIADKFITHIDFFMSEGFRDYQVVVYLLDILIEYYRLHGPEYRLFDCYYFMASQLMEMYEYEKACEYFRRALELYENTDDCKEEYRKFKIMCSHYYRYIAAVCDKNASQNTVLLYHDMAFKAWVEEPIIDFLTDKKIRGIENIIQTLACIAIEKYLAMSIEVKPEFMDAIGEEYNTQKKIYGGETEINTAIYVTYNKLRLVNGIITETEYNNLICKKYEYEAEREKVFSYGKTDFIGLFDDEVLDEDFDVNKLCFMNHSYAYINILLPELIEIYKTNDFIKEFERYYIDFPIVRGNYLIDFMIEGHIKKIFRYCENEEEAINAIEKILINRQVVTLIHSNMVSKLAEAVVKRFVKNAPEIFVGLFGIKTPDETDEHKKQIIDFVAKAGILHDIGKIMCADVINLQLRRICDKEFEIIKKHPKRAAEILKNIPVLSKYADVALGHHKSFDGNYGYPEDFDNNKSDIKVLVDIIRICDSIDAATDFLGRNYANAKDFNIVLNELIAGKGSTYSDIVVDAISRDEFLKKELERIIGEDRRQTYYDVYHKIVEPVISYGEEDELYVRHFENEDMEKLLEFLGGSEEEFKKQRAVRGEHTYILTNGRKNIFGYIIYQASDDIESVYITDIFIDKKHRRNGYGSVMLKAIERLAEIQGYKTLFIPNIKEGHHDIFGWRNGYSGCDNPNILKKEL